MRNKKRVLQLLFDHGIDLDCRCETGKTPIHYAAQYGGRFGSYVETFSLNPGLLLYMILLLVGIVH